MQDQTVYWREASNGLATLPYFLGSSFVDLYYVILAPLIFVGPWFAPHVGARGLCCVFSGRLTTVWGALPW